MFRSALDALDVLGRLKQAGVSLHMIDLGGDTTGDGVSKLIFTILSAVAEADRDRTRERIAEVKRDQREQGRYWVGIHRSAGASARPASLAPILEQQAAVKRMRQLWAEGLALRSIATEMAASACGSATSG
jgi:putative DNA-invertase from lambdoid prophage Rac